MIKVRPEGRKDIWIPEKQSLKEYICEKKLKTIHNAIIQGNLIIGADHEIISVLEDVDMADRWAIFTDRKMNYKHSLALIRNNELQIYDIGEIKKEDLEIIKGKVG